MREIISVKNLYKLYRVGDSVVRALDGVSFSVYEGEFCAIVGTSGSGKSTLLNMLAGLEKPTRGEVIVAGKHIEQMKENELVKFRGENVGFIFQSFHLMGTMNALENVALPLTFRGEPRKERIKKADRMLDLVSLEKHKKHLPNQLSGEPHPSSAWQDAPPASLLSWFYQIQDFPRLPAFDSHFPVPSQESCPRLPC